MTHLFCAAVVFLATPADASDTAEAKKPDAPKVAQKAPAKPALMRHRREEGKLAYRLVIRPGVPEPNENVAVELEVSEILAAPDPRYGTRKPVEDAELTAYLVAPETKGKRRRKAERWTAARRAVRLRDAGSYGFSFTAPREGVYGLHVRGKSKSVGEVSLSEVVSFGVWPIPEEAKTPPPMPKSEPNLEAGDLAHGKALCAERCRKDLSAALPSGKTPTFLHSDAGAALSDNELLATMVSDDGPRLTLLERNDLLYYLRSLHQDIRQFFPEAAAVVVNTFTINEHGKKRLKESYNLEPTKKEATAKVFAVYGKASHSGAPKLIAFDDRIARGKLDHDNKLGYLMFLSMPKESKATELAVALGKEPTYPILALVARDAKGQKDRRLNQKLASFVGQGRFNDPNSLRRGSRTLQKKLIPIYLRAAELATMYYAAEREFTAFDAEFSDDGGDDEKPEVEVKLKY